MTDATWTDAVWLDEAAAWIEAALKQRNVAVIGPIEQPHVRPWSTVLRTPTSAGYAYFKAVSPALKHEIAVTAALAQMHPELLPTMLTTDAQRGWMLMDDGGLRLREVITADHNLRHWERALPRYAELQIEAAAHLQSLLAAGLPDRRLESMPAQFAALLADGTWMRVNLPDGLTADEHQRLLGDTATVTDLCAQLSASPVPQSIHHGDLHDGNIFMRQGRYVFFDWGDACATQPFFSMRTVYVSVENTLGLPEGAPDFVRLRDAYLEPWTQFERRSKLKEAFATAQKLSPLFSAFGWQRSLAALDDAGRAEYAHVVPSLLREYLGVAHA